MKIGTKETFRNWLTFTKHMTYTRYSRLKPEEKQVIQKEYKGMKVKPKN